MTAHIFNDKCVGACNMPCHDTTQLLCCICRQSSSPPPPPAAGKSDCVNLICVISFFLLHRVEDQLPNGGSLCGALGGLQTPLRLCMAHASSVQHLLADYSNGYRLHFVLNGVTMFFFLIMHYNDLACRWNSSQSGNWRSHCWHHKQTVGKCRMCRI